MWGRVLPPFLLRNCFGAIKPLTDRLRVMPLDCSKEGEYVTIGMYRND